MEAATEAKFAVGRRLNVSRRCVANGDKWGRNMSLDFPAC